MAHTHQTVSFGFNLTKNIPIDRRLKINSLATVDTEIPVALRYEGLIFICEDGQVNYQNDKSRFYTFDANLKPILLFDYLNRRVKLGLEVEPADYPNLNTVLDQNCYPVLGTMVYVTPLDILVKWNGTKWETILGSIKVKTEAEYKSLPDNFKNQGFSVIINNGVTPEQTKVILDDLLLSDVVIVGNTNIGVNYGSTQIYDLSSAEAQDKFWKNNPDLNRFFLIDHALFFNLNGTLYQVNEDCIVVPCYGQTPATVYESETFCSEKPEAYFVLQDHEKKVNSRVYEIMRSTYPDIENYGSGNVGETVYGDNSMIVTVDCHVKRKANIYGGTKHIYTLDVPKSDALLQETILNKGLVQFVVITSGMSMARMQQKGVEQANPLPTFHSGGDGSN